MIDLRPACLLFLCVILTSLPVVSQQPASESDVRVIVTATDSSRRPINGLTKEQFSVFEKKTSLDITYFDAEDRPVSVALVFDLSKSMNPTFRKHAAQIAATIVRDSNANNEYTIIGVSDPPQVICELGCGSAEILKVLQELAGGEPKEGNTTRLYDAYDLALKKLESARNTKRALIAFTDGDDNFSALSFPRLRDKLKQSTVIFYALGFVMPNQSIFSDIAAANLDELGDVSGGETYFPVTKNNMNEFANAITLQLRQQYTIGFRPVQPTPDGKWHSIKIKLTMPKSPKTSLYLRYRESYFSR